MQEPPLGDSSGRRASLPLVVARILIVSGIGFASALGLFFIVGGAWQVGLISLALTLVFILLMFFLERAAETGSPS